MIVQLLYDCATLITNNSELQNNYSAGFSVTALEPPRISGGTI